MQSSLSQKPINPLVGSNSKKVDAMEKVGIKTYEDLLYYFPYKYIDRRRVYKISEINADMPYIQLKGHILYFDMLGEGRTKRLIARFTDGTGNIELVWFRNFSFITSRYLIKKEYIVFGKPSEFNGTINIVHPDLEVEMHDESVSRSFMPLYSTTEMMKKLYLNSRAIHNLIYKLMQEVNSSLSETLPQYLIEKIKMINLREAMINVHFPESVGMLKAARTRLKFDELFFIQLHILQSATLRKARLKGFTCPSIGHFFNTFYRDYLPFNLTEAQKRVMREIRADMGSGKQMNRLLQGDVGSGKTLVALLAMLIALDNNYQACMMAPTEILANQHFVTVKNFLDDMSIKVELLTGSTSTKERKRIHEGLSTGEINILIGTHALIEKAVCFSSLGLAIIDEQHRFGVEQRAQLWQKNEKPPHVLVMTATPIPRTLAMTLYGDLDVSVIDELPPGRKPILTLHRYDNKKAELFAFLRKEIALGRQAYVVYPLIEESEKLDYKDLEEGFNIFREVFPDYNVCMVHGRMKASEKDAEMQKFISGEAKILLATTVIEVGVNVPNASVMVIESAERFGLSQLHQLRGRVGRGSEQSYCILVSSYKLSDDTRRRLEIMVQTNNGFEIAEADLRMRGHGDLEGTQQSGVGIDLRIADLASDGQLLQYARDMANDVLSEDPKLESNDNKVLRERLHTLFSHKANWGLIS